MTFFSGFVTKFSQVLNKLAGFFLVATVTLIVSNIGLRVVINKPFLGTYEYVSLFSAALIGLSLADCAVKKGHIAVTIVFDKFPILLKTIIDSSINLAGFCFWSLAAWHVCRYGFSLMNSGVVSPTTQIPFYPFVFLVAVGLLALCLVLLTQFVESFRKLNVLDSLFERSIIFSRIPQKGGNL